MAGAIAEVIREGKQMTIQVIGAGAVNQAVKAIAIASLCLKHEGLDLVCAPSFTTVAIGGRKRTAVRLEAWSAEGSG